MAAVPHTPSGAAALVVAVATVVAEVGGAAEAVEVAAGSLEVGRYNWSVGSTVLLWCRSSVIESHC